MLTGDRAELIILRKQFSKATVSKRQFTGGGFFTNFDIPSTCPRLKRKDPITITDVSAAMPDLKHGAGFVLFIEKGAMNCLEGFCYDESWPDSPCAFTLSYLQESTRGSGGVILSKKRDVKFAFKDFAAEI